MKLSILKGQVAVLASDITVEMVKTVKAFNPAALVLKDADKNEIFSVNITEGQPAISAHGLTVAKKKDIVVSFDKPVTEKDVKEYFGPALIRLGALEAQVKVAYDAAVTAMSGITIEVVE